MYLVYTVLKQYFSLKVDYYITISTQALQIYSTILKSRNI